MENPCASSNSKNTQHFAAFCPNGFIITFPYNAHTDWLKQRALSEISERVDDIQIFVRNLDKFDPNYKHPLCDSDKSQYKRAICQQ